MKEYLLCPGCGRKVKFEELRPAYIKKNFLAKQELGWYEFKTRKCYKCKTIAEFDKDYVRNLWEQQHQSLKIARKL